MTGDNADAVPSCSACPMSLSRDPRSSRVQHRSHSTRGWTRLALTSPSTRASSAMVGRPLMCVARAPAPLRGAPASVSTVTRPTWSSCGPPVRRPNRQRVDLPAAPTPSKCTAGAPTGAHLHRPCLVHQDHAQERHACRARATTAATPGLRLHRLLRLHGDLIPPVPFAVPRRSSSRRPKRRERPIVQTLPLMLGTRAYYQVPLHQDGVPGLLPGASAWRRRVTPGGVH